MPARSRSNGHKVFVPARHLAESERLASGAAVAMRGIVDTVLPKLSGAEYAALQGHVLALSRTDYDAMGRLAVEMDKWVTAAYPRVAALKRPVDTGDIAMAIDADRDSFPAELPGAESGTRKPGPTLLAVLLGMLMGGSMQ